MTIRELRREDIEEVIKLLKQMIIINGYREEYPSHQPDDLTLKVNLMYSLKSNDFDVFIAEHKEKIIGIAGITYYSSFWDSKDLFANTIFWDSNPECPKIEQMKAMIKLQETMEERVREKGGTVFTIYSDINYVAPEKYLKKIGYILRNLPYCKEI